jgi:chemotaxis protein CheZ
MAVQRKRYRIEEVQSGGAPVFEGIESDAIPFHNEIMNELREIRKQMALAPRREDAPANETKKIANETAAAKAMLASYRAQIEQCEKLKVELDLIHEAINRTKEEIALLYGTSFHGDEMAKVAGELGEVVGGTEQATQKILEAAEAIDQAAGALSKPTTPEQQLLIGEDIQDRVVGIFEACNFQDLTGQRISKVMATMKFIENHINVMMDIWGGVDAIKKHAPAVADTRVGDARLLNGPKGADEAGHVSQDDIDALFD